MAKQSQYSNSRYRSSSACARNQTPKGSLSPKAQVSEAISRSSKDRVIYMFPDASRLVASSASIVGKTSRFRPQVSRSVRLRYAGMDSRARSSKRTAGNSRSKYPRMEFQLRSISVSTVSTETMA